MLVTLWPCAALFILIACLHTHSLGSAQCPDQQKSLLLQLRNSLDFSHPTSTKLIWWNQSTDCCQWNGVECDPSTGQVIGLDLSQELISNRIDNSSSLFHLLSLRSLNLALLRLDDPFAKMPSAFGKLTGLTYLNLSLTGFTGQVPIELSHLSNLVVLDLSCNVDQQPYTLHIENPNLKMIAQNMTNLRELYLDGVLISANENDWCEAMSSSFPHLQVLSMASCNLTGEIDSSLSKLHSLSVIRLDENLLASPVPMFLANFTNLTTLSLSGCGLTGNFPSKIFQVPTLTTLDLSYNYMLQGHLPEHQMSTSLQTLVLSSTNVCGSLPNSIGNLKRLRWIELSECSCSGIIPSSFSSLTQLEYLDLSKNSFYGSITTIDWGGLQKLVHVDFSNNSLIGSIPMSIFSSPSLQSISLAYNQFKGIRNEFVSIPSSMLDRLDLNNNNLEGPFPRSFFLLRGLSELDLSLNRFNGTLQLNEIFQQFKNLTRLDLSHNYLSIDASGINENSSIPQLQSLHLASCNLRTLPEFLRNQSHLTDLDLSKNQIQEKVPWWIWEVGGLLTFLNLSYNNFVDLEPPRQDIDSCLVYLDLHSNKLHGKIPLVPSVYLDLSNNMFNSVIPEIGNYLEYTKMLSLSKSYIYGTIPISLCNAKGLEVLDLGYNYLNGTIPSCLIEMSSGLGVLNLKGNNLSGAIPDEFNRSCRLETLDFNGNSLEGRIPSSLANCKRLKLLDLGNNQFNGKFPCQLQGLFDLQVLILRSNKFHGTITCNKRSSIWSSLQVLDISYNNFSGELTSKCLLKWTRMMITVHGANQQFKYLQYIDAGLIYYQDTMVLTFKDNEYVLEKILTTFTAIDLSNNAFHGELPREVGNLIALRILNLSHNSFTGNIPSTISNLSLVESLDLSHNAFNGSIPPQLAKLNFLDCLNLSFNKLSGQIPTGTQLQSFDPSSYMGNPGLYGPPLTARSRSMHTPELTPATQPDGSTWSITDELEWMLRGAEVGFPVGITLFLGPLLYIKRYRRWYSYQVDRLLVKVMPREGHRRRTRRDRATRKQRQRR